MRILLNARRVLAFLAVAATASEAFTSSSSWTTRQTRQSTYITFATNPSAAETVSSSSPSRRNILLQWTTTTTAALVVAALPLSAQAATATTGSDNALFKGNPLTNSVLEQIRIWEQAEADNLKYGGELERGDAGNKGQTAAYPRLLVPILQMAYQLETVNAAVRDGRARYPEAVALLKQPVYQKIEFKKIFNKYSDNIYYADPDRANLYLGGGAMPKTAQSLAYLLRNEILTNVEDLQAELDYLMAHPDESDDTDAKSYAASANAAMQRYLEVVPPNELKQAKELLMNQ